METINLNPAPAPVPNVVPDPAPTPVVKNTKGGTIVFVVLIVVVLFILGGVAYYFMNRDKKSEIKELPIGPIPGPSPGPPSYVGPTPDTTPTDIPDEYENINLEALDANPGETKENEVKFVTSAPPPPPPPPSEPAAKSSLDDLKPKLEFATTTKEPTEESTMLNIRERVTFVTPAKNEKAVEEIRMGIAQGVVEEIQQAPMKGKVTQEIQQVGMKGNIQIPRAPIKGVVQEIPRAPMKRKVTQGIQQVGMAQGYL